jgi:hypothetical protein
MILYRTLAGIVPMCLGWAVYSGAIPLTFLMGGSSTHDVAASPATVDAAIADLTLQEFTGSLMDTGPMDAGERWVKTAQIEGGRSWTLMEGKKEVLVMTAHETPYDGGAATEVTAEVAKGKDYDVNRLPAGLRDLNLVSTVFNAALDEELNPLMPEGERLTRIKAEERRLAVVTKAMSAAIVSNPMAIAIDARKRELSFRDSLDEAERASKERESNQPPPGVSFTPGQPMVDPTPRSPSSYR